MKRKITNTLLVVGLAICMFLGNIIPGITMTVKAEETDGIHAFVSRMYTVALGREAEAAGLNDWSTQLANQTNDGAGIAFGFIMSEELKNKNLSNADYVTTLYKTFFDRVPDEGGYNVWMEQLENGTDRGEVLAGFVNSVEFSNLCEKFGILRGYMYADGTAANPGIAQFVSRLYSEALGRAGDASGINEWTMLIATKAWSAEGVATVGFFDSAEFQQKTLSDSEFLDILYATFFNRAADAEGKAIWMDNLSAGTSRSDVILGFSRSEEFINLLKLYGLYEEKVEVPEEKKTVYLLSQATMEWDGWSTSYITCEYDENGNLIKKTQQNDFGTTIGVYTYDSEGRLLKEEYRKSDGNLTDLVHFFDEEELSYHRNTDYAYDANGNLIQCKKYREDGTVFEQFVNTYDENGNLLKKQYSDTFWYDYYYDDDFNLTLVYCYHNGKRSTEVKNVYDENGNKIESWGYVSMSSGFPITYYGENGKPVRTVYRDRDGNILPSVYNEYDAYGNLVKMVEGSDISTWQYTYDANGNVTSVVTPFGGTTVYTYDEHGNCIAEQTSFDGEWDSTITYTYISMEVTVK